MASKVAITNRGKKWEILNSLWILFSICFFGFIGFFIIGKKGKQKKWLISGVIYLVIFILSISMPEQYNDFSLTLFALGWAVSIAHSFLVRKKYLIRRDIILRNGINEKEEAQKVAKIRNEIEAEYNVSKTISSDDIQDLKNKLQRNVTQSVSVLTENSVQETVEEQFIAPVKNIEPIKTLEVKRVEESEISNTDGKTDINNCSVDDLASLVGVSIVMAKKADNYRREHNGFFSVDEFFAVIELKPHFIAQIEDKLVCGVMRTVTVEQTTLKSKAESISTVPKVKEKKGRVLDI